VLVAQAFAFRGVGTAVADSVKDVIVANDSNNPVPVTGKVTLDPSGNTVQGAVSVNNTADNPVPVGGTVNVGNTPTVKAQQGGTWAVSLNDTPVVGIDSSGNTVKLDANGNTVQVGNDASHPVPVTMTNSPATHQPVVFSGLAQMWDYGDDQDNHVTDRTVSLYTVPQGKRLVIESISADGFSGNDNGFMDVRLEVPQRIGLPLTQVGQTGGVYSVMAASDFHTYVSPGSDVSLFIERNDTDNVLYLNVTVSGYLEDAS
jgi:hypothetical protein